MKKLKKNFRPENQTIEAMRNSCTGGCSCGTVSCGCGSDVGAQHNQYYNFITQQQNAFKNGAW